MPCDFQYLAVVTFIKEGGWQRSGLLGQGTFLEKRGINSSSQPASGGACLWLLEEETPGSWAWWCRCPLASSSPAARGRRWSPVCWPSPSWGQGAACTLLLVVPAEGHIIYLFVNFPVVLHNFTSSSHLPAFLLYFFSLVGVWSIYGCWAASGIARMGNWRGKK